MGNIWLNDHVKKFSKFIFRSANRRNYRSKFVIFLMNFHQTINFSRNTTTRQKFLNQFFIIPFEVFSNIIRCRTFFISDWVCFLLTMTSSNLLISFNARIIQKHSVKVSFKNFHTKLVTFDAETGFLQLLKKIKVLKI